MTIPQLTLYTRPHCCLCDKAEALIHKVGREVPLALTCVDISGNDELEALWGEKIPVVALNGEIAIVSRVSEFWIRRILAGDTSARLRAL